MTYDAMAKLIGISVDSFKPIRRGKVATSIDRAEEICEALGLEFYIGPRRFDAAKDTIDLAQAEAASWNGGFEWAERAGMFVTPWPVPVRDQQAAHGTAGFSPHGCAWFGVDFLAKFDLDPKLCEVIEVRDDSMAPVLVAGSVGLVDLARSTRREGALYAVERADELLVRRAARDGDAWQLTASNPDWPASPWSADVKMIGQVVWSARMIGVSP